jgi:hypothetical protein
MLEDEKQQPEEAQSTPAPVDTRERITVAGVTFLIDRFQKWPGKVFRYAQNGQYVELLEVVVGKEAYEQFEETHTLEDVKELTGVIMAKVGNL